MCCSDDDEADASLLSNTLVRTQAASLGPEQHSHRNAVANDNTVDGYVQEERRWYAPGTACVRFHAPLQKRPHGLNGIVLEATAPQGACQRAWPKANNPAGQQSPVGRAKGRARRQQSP